MAHSGNIDPLLLIVAVFSRHPAALEWTHRKLEIACGPVVFSSLRYDFNQTCYYEPTMGPGLRKQFLAFGRLVAADALAQIKCLTNLLETELARSRTYPEERPVNLDPGVLSLGKFMLATTKDQSHRIYMRDGIYAEVTLRFQAGRFEPWPWTYSDYRQPAVLAFFNEAREWYRHNRNRPERMKDEG
jgi:hypothetical protein